MQRGELNVDPIQSEFFSTEAISGLTEALVRESIQNSLDAAERVSTAIVRFWLSGTNNALPAHRVSAYFDELEEHLHAKGSGLQNLPALSSGIPFLLIEDFNTRGLRGDPEQEKDVSGQKNDFYYFWRNVGRSSKQENDRGRWGLGKNVFPASSRINTFLGLTVRREQPSTLLMGQSVLKVHEVNGNRVYPYGYLTSTAPSDGFVRPITEALALEPFRKEFCLSRSVETGLSIVVPFPDEEITAKRILEAVLRQYFYPIMVASLIVKIQDNESDITVDKDNLIQIVHTMPAEFNSELEPFLKLVQWASVTEEFVKTKTLKSKAAPKWETDALSEEAIKDLRLKFERGAPLAFEIPVHVRPASGTEQQSYLRVFLERDPKLESHRALYIREGLI